MKKNTINLDLHITLKAALRGALVMGLVTLGEVGFAASTRLQATTKTPSKLTLLSNTNPKKDLAGGPKVQTIAQNTTAASPNSSSLTTQVSETSSGKKKPWAIEMN